MKAQDTNNTTGRGLAFAGIPVNEQETVIVIDRETRRATIYTTDTRYMNKLDKIYKRKNTRLNDGKIAALEYEVPEKLVSFRSKATKRNLTEEQRQAFTERMKKAKEA